MPPRTSPRGRQNPSIYGVARGRRVASFRYSTWAYWKLTRLSLGRINAYVNNYNGPTAEVRAVMDRSCELMLE